MRVIDASVVMKAMFEDEPGHTKARTVVQKGGIVPEWLFMEVANVLATKTGFTNSETAQLLELVYEIGFKVERVDRKMVEEAMMLAKRYKVTVYDMVYAVTAKKLGLEMVSADLKFVRKVRLSFVKGLLGRRS